MAKKPDQKPEEPMLDVDEDLDALEEAPLDHVVDRPTPPDLAREPRRPRQGDQHRPTCPRCSTTEQPVFLVAASTQQLFTWYSCPTPECGHRIKVARPDIQQVLGRRTHVPPPTPEENRSGPADFSAR